jgi:DNA-binding MarR family transcriptional regulator
MMQTSTIYDRLRRDEKEEPKQSVRISALAFLQRLPRNFTRPVADDLGEELGIKVRAVTHHLQTLCRKGYIVRIRQGVYSKAARTVKKNGIAS